MDHFAKGIVARQKAIADKATTEARESLRHALKYPADGDKQGKPRWERDMGDKPPPRRRPHHEKQSALKQP